MIDEGATVVKIAEFLNVDDSSIRRNAHRLGVWRKEWKFSNFYLRKYRQSTMPVIREQHRAAWLKACQEHPEASISKIMKIVPPAYDYLRIADNAWLKAHSPKLNRVRYIVDWQDREAKMIEAVRRAVAIQLGTTSRPERICARSLARWTRIGCLAVKDARMPELCAVVESVHEDSVGFRKRVLAWAALRLAEEGVVPSSSALLRRAGIRRAPPVSLLEREFIESIQSLKGHAVPRERQIGA
jgi:hypothetical protein